MTLSQSQAKKATEFVKEYINILNPKALNKDGTLTNPFLQSAVKMLVEEQVFTVKEIKQELLRKYRVILPEWVFEGVKK